MMIFAITLAFLFILGIAIFYTMFVKPQEGFDDVPNSWFIPRIAPSGYEEESLNSPAPAFNQSVEKLVESSSLPAMDMMTARKKWAKMTSETCFRSDIGESLKRTRNYLQRTNNYKRTHPDSCSAPNHEFVGTFYTPWNGVGNKPSCGVNFPKSTQCYPQ
jgi:hypothetical protein